MESHTTYNVNDIPLGERTAIEHLLGQPLRSDQSVFIMAFSPGLASEATRSAARERLQRQFQSQADRTADVSAAEADAAVDEAMQQVRPRFE